MSLELSFYKFIEIILLPPGINIILFLSSYFLINIRPKLALGLFAVALITIYLFSLPIVSNALNFNLQTEIALTPSKVKKIADRARKDIAIVILPAGRIYSAPEYGDIDTVSPNTLQRIQYAAWLHGKTDLPILLSGGSTSGEATPEAVLMNQSMLSSFNIAPKWIEFKSSNLIENAKYSSKILLTNQIVEIILVTHSAHMASAKKAFERTGLKVISAPTGFNRQQSNWTNYFPSAYALYQSTTSLKKLASQFFFEGTND